MVDFKEQLSRQLGFLETSCNAFDQGNADEAVRIAVSLRILFHDTQNSISLLNHLGAKNILLLSTTDVHPKLQVLTLGLVRPSISVNLGMVSCRMDPRLDTADRKELVIFQTWWRKENVIELNCGANTLNRRDLILAAANKDGGAHVDTKLEPTYDKAKLGAGMSVVVRFGDGHREVTASFDNIHYASIRQLAYEVLNSNSITSLK